MDNPCLISAYPNDKEKFDYFKQFLDNNQIGYELPDKTITTLPLNCVFVDEKDLNFILLVFNIRQFQNISAKTFYKKDCFIGLIKWFVV